MLFFVIKIDVFCVELRRFLIHLMQIFVIGMIGYKKGCLLLCSITLAVCTAQIEALNLYHLENL